MYAMSNIQNLLCNQGEITTKIVVFFFGVLYP